MENKSEKSQIFMSRKKQKAKTGKTISAVFIILGVLLLGFASWKILSWKKAQTAATKLFREMESISAASAPEATELQGESSQADVSEQAESYPGPAVEITALQEQYTDLVGWLWADGLWSLPIMQGEDNWYWLYHLPDGSWNNAGCLTMDCTTAKDLSDPSTVIYGHNMFPSGMFHELPNFKSQDFYEQHKTMYYFAADGKLYRCTPFAGYTTTYEDDPEAFLPTMDHWQAAIERSDFNGGEGPKPGQPVLTLITCISLEGDSRYILHCTMDQIS